MSIVGVASAHAARRRAAPASGGLGYTCAHDARATDVRRRFTRGSLVIDMGCNTFCALVPLMSGETTEVENEGGGMLPDVVLARCASPAGAAS
jgi:hypothetical protein